MKFLVHSIKTEDREVLKKMFHAMDTEKTGTLKFSEIK